MQKKNSRRKMVVGNWKMNPVEPVNAKAIWTGVKKRAAEHPKVDIVMCPPFVFLSELTNPTDHVFLGAQSVSHEEAGSHTGEVSAAQLRAVGATHVIVGHSERRALFETNELVNHKIHNALDAGLSVILCVGELKRDSDVSYLDFIRLQLQESLSRVMKKNLSKIVIAYEPVWAIGKSYAQAMAGKDVQQISIFIKKVIADMYDMATAHKVKILYGGSVAPSNAQEIILNGGVDGFLVGRQSLEPQSFGDIISLVDF